MKIKGMEHVDNFGLLENTCWLAVDDVPECFIKEAKKIDGENYSENCFGICVIQTEDGWFVCEDSPNCELFYIDNDGDKHWMEYSLTNDEANIAIDYCISYIWR